jgi:hypothetical protein
VSDRHRTETDLRDQLRDGAVPGARGIDLPTVLRRSARRRLPVQLALGTGVALAVVSIGVAGVVGVRGLSGGSGTTSGTSTLSEGTPDSDRDPAVDAPGVDPGVGPVDGAPADGGLTRAPADKLNFCGAPMMDIALDDTGLILTAAFPDGAAGSERVDGTVTLTNGGTSRVVGTTAATPAVTLSRDGLVLWHSNGPTIAMAMQVDLDPGESLTYESSFVPVECGVEDDGLPSFRDGLPAVPAGAYQVSAAIDLIVADGTPVLVTGPLAPVTLR